MDTCQRGRLGKQGDQPSAGAQQEQGGEFEESLGGSLALVGDKPERRQGGGTSAGQRADRSGLFQDCVLGSHGKEARKAGGVISRKLSKAWVRR